MSHIASSGKMFNEWCIREDLEGNYRDIMEVISQIYMGESMKPMKYLSQYTWCPFRESNWAPTEYRLTRCSTSDVLALGPAVCAQFECCGSPAATLKSVTGGNHYELQIKWDEDETKSRVGQYDGLTQGGWESDLTALCWLCSFIVSFLSPFGIAGTN
jgi:hypothetical protein